MTISLFDWTFSIEARKKIKWKSGGIEIEKSFHPAPKTLLSVIKDSYAERGCIMDDEDVKEKLKGMMFSNHMLRDK